MHYTNLAIIYKPSASLFRDNNLSIVLDDCARRKIYNRSYLSLLSTQVLVASGFDYETAPFYEAWVEVRDSDTPALRSVVQLLVNVTDANDNAPVMEAAIYNATVPEEEYPPLFVGKVSAKDRDSGENGQVSYYLVNDFTETFIIDSDNGEISTNAKLDREEVSTVLIEFYDREKKNILYE